MSRTNKAKLWFGLGTILCFGFIGKQLLWKKIEDIVQSKLDQEHRIATAHLERVHERSKRFSIKALPKESADQAQDQQK